MLYWQRHARGTKGPVRKHRGERGRARGGDTVPWRQHCKAEAEIDNTTRGEDMNLAVYITGHGYGHLTRTLEVVRKLYELHDQGPNPASRPLQVHVRAPYPLTDVVDALGRPPDSHARIRLDVGIVQEDALNIHMPATLAWLEHYFGPDGDQGVAEEAAWLQKTGVDVALVDIPPRAFDACNRAGVPAVGLANFGWDWIWRHLARKDPRFEPFARAAAKAYASCHLLLRTVMSRGLETFPRCRAIPLIARVSPHTSEGVRRRLHLPVDRPLVLLSFGGEGLSGLPKPDPGLFDRIGVILTSPLPDPGDPFIFVAEDRMRREGLRYCDLIKAVDLVITKPGYSTVAECLANRTAMLWTGRDDFPEAPVVIDYIQKHIPNRYISREDLLEGRWGEAVEALLQRPGPFADVPVNGAEVAAHALLQFALDPSRP